MDTCCTLNMTHFSGTRALHSHRSSGRCLYCGHKIPGESTPQRSWRHSQSTACPPTRPQLGISLNRQSSERIVSLSWNKHLTVGEINQVYIHPEQSAIKCVEWQMHEFSSEHTPFLEQSLGHAARAKSAHTTAQIIILKYWLLLSIAQKTKNNSILIVLVACNNYDEASDTSSFGN